jgi:predicted oxidoreductase
MHGKRALEGTFLGGCVYSGRVAARAIQRGQGVR